MPRQVGHDEPFVAREPVLDEEALGEIRALDPQGTRNVLVRVIRVYLEEAPVLLRSLLGEVERADPVRLWQAAHALKTASANLGAARLAAACRELEALGRSGRADGATELAAGATAAFDEAQRALSALLPGAGRGPV